MKRLPGPAPTSCLTCRQRKKKCDRAHPFCNRCTEGGYQCLGYGHTQSRSGLVHPHDDSLPLSEAEDMQLCETISTSRQASDPIYDAPKRVALVQQIRDGITTDSVTHMAWRLPPKLIPDSQTSGLSIRFILSQYESLFELVFFQPIQNHLSHIRGLFIGQIMSSSIMHSSLYVGAQMFRALQQDKEHADVKRFAPLVDRLSLLSASADNDVSLDDLAGRLSGALELVFLKLLTSGVNSSYQLLRYTAPLLMQVAFADPTLWPRDPSSNGISLAHALSSPRYQIGRFIFVDMTTSLTYGVPPLVEYDTSYPISRAHGEYPPNWIHACPPEFLLSIVKVNQWRAQHPNGYLDEDAHWEEIEENTQAWRPMCHCDPDSDSSQLVMRFAAQESWKHAVLIYLYMGMCGVTSHDPRVQFSVQQISRLHTTINSQSHNEMHLMIPFLLAAICTQSEADRRKFRVAVSHSACQKTRVSKPVNFGFVLDHLWHGIAWNGGAVTWDDYIRSRKAMIDINL